jgi:hypothetical protein
MDVHTLAGGVVVVLFVSGLAELLLVMVGFLRDSPDCDQPRARQPAGMRSGPTEPTGLSKAACSAGRRGPSPA